MQEIHLDTIDSTNTYAKKHAATLSKTEMTCITAEEQTAGRGRYQRKWVSPRGVNIYATFCFRLPSKTLHLGSIAQVMACSFATLLLHEGFHPKIKWPNDLYLNGKKLSGILCETLFSANEVEVFLGIGINVNMAAEIAASIDQPATSLMIETGKKWDKGDVLKKLQKQFTQDLHKFKSQGFAPFHAQFEKLLAFKGETVRCFDGQTTWTGICQSITDDGQLILLMPDKTLHVVISGDILV